MLCELGLHRVDRDAAVWNVGIGFSRCVRCGREMVRRSGRSWGVVPRGYAVVWRPAGEAEIGLRAATDTPQRPDAPYKKAEPAALRVLNGLKRIGAAADRSLGALVPPCEQASRSYRYLVRRIAAARVGDQPVRTILLSSVCGAEAANESLLLLSAMMQDELGGRLLIIDATLRDGGIGAMMGAEERPGLSEARAEDPYALLEMIRPLPRPDHYLLGVGLCPAATRVEDMAAILPVLARHFDHILIQQQAVTADTRYLALAQRADLVLVVAEEGRSRMASLIQAREAFRANGIGNVGLILSVPPADAAAPVEDMRDAA